MSWKTRIMFWRPSSPGPSCLEIMEVVQSYLDGEIDADTAAGVTAHLDMCQGCEREADAYRKVIERLQRCQAHTVDERVISALELYGRSLIDGGEPTVATEA